MKLEADYQELPMVSGKLKSLLSPGGVVGLSGKLGAGKTALVRQLTCGDGGFSGEVTSPTFTLQNIYQPVELPGGAVSHWDLYRISEGSCPEDVFELFPGVTFIEWPEIGGERLLNLLSIHVTIAFSTRGDGFRSFEIISNEKR